MMHWFPCFAGLVQICWVNTSADLLCDLLEFDVDAMPLAVGVGSHLLLWRKRGFRIAVTLTHRATSCGGELLPFTTQ
ncbi:hypothetical protein N9E02_02095 [Ilumatobacteraceae bacterium]|jgi:hypothetical protein|nr:hypothetical protein [Ilumatobacteraceae bacterium]